jgi:hypothetical protein
MMYHRLRQLEPPNDLIPRLSLYYDSVMVGYVEVVGAIDPEGLVPALRAYFEKMPRVRATWFRVVDDDTGRDLLSIDGNLEHVEP